MTNTQIINELAKKIVEKCGENIGKPFDHAPNESMQLYDLISREVERRYGHDKIYELYFDSIYTTFFATLKRFDPERNFWNYFNGALENKIKDEIQKRVKEDYDKPQRKKRSEQQSPDNDAPKEKHGERIRFSLDEPNDEGLTLGDTVIDSSANTEKSTDEKMYEIFYLALVDHSLMQKAIYSKRKTINYTILFFTDQIAYEIIQHGDELIMGIIDRNEAKFNEASDIDFLNSFVDKRCVCISDAAKAEYLPLSHFTGKEKDAGKPCRTPSVIPYSVFIKYISDRFNENKTNSAINQQYEKYNSAKHDIWQNC